MIEGWEKIGFPDKTTATQIAFITVGIWWLVFSIPIVRHVKESAKGVSVSYGDAIKSGFMRIGKTMKTASRYPELLKYMAAFWFFNDGINTVIVMATIYGSGIGIELQISSLHCSLHSSWDTRVRSCLLSSHPGLARRNR